MGKWNSNYKFFGRFNIIENGQQLPIDAFDVVVIDDDDDVMVELIDVVSLGVIGPADCGPGVKPGWLIDFWRTSRIFNCKLCLFGNISRCFICKCVCMIVLIFFTMQDLSLFLSAQTWNSFVSFELGNMPQLLNNSITNWRRCSNVLRWPFSAATSELQLVRVLTDELPPLTLQPVPMPLLGCCNGVRGVRGDRSLSLVFKSARNILPRMSDFHTCSATDESINTYPSVDRYWNRDQRNDVRLRLVVLLSTDLKSILHYSAVGRRRRLKGKSESLKLVSSLDENANGGRLTWFGRMRRHLMMACG